MLEEALKQFKESYNIYFIDATITLNSPKISQYRGEIIANVAKLLGISKNNLFLLQDSLANFKDNNIFIKSDLFLNKLKYL